MKLRKNSRYFITMVLAVVVLASVPHMPSNAGASELVIDNQSFAETLDNQLWNDVDGDIAVEGGMIVFPTDSTSNTALITKKVAQSSGKHENIVKAESSIQFTQLPQGEKFAFALGLQSVSSMMAEPENIEIIFTNNGGLKVSVVVYDEDGNSKTFCGETSCGSLKNSVRIRAEISAESLLTVSVNGKQLCKDTLPVSGTGRVGFIQSGNCGVKVQDVEIVSYKYDNPTNVNIDEDFEEGTLNTNTLVSKTVVRETNYVDTNIGIVKMEDGNSVFEAKNATPFYIGALYQYSNFELTFDVPYIQKEEVLNDNREIISPATTRFAISFGGEAKDSANYHYVNAADLLIFSKDSSISSLYTGNKASAVDVGYDFFSKDIDRGFSVKLSVVDSVITVGMKWIDEESYTDVLSYQISKENPLGYVHVWSLDMGATWAIDNLKILNKDINPQLTEVDFESDLMKIPEDYDYKPEARVYQEDSKDNSIYLLIPGSALVCIVGITITWIFTKKSNKKKGGASDE